MDAQRTLQTEWLGLISDGARTRVMLANQLGNELPRPIIVVAGFALMMCFPVLALLVGAISVGGATFLLLELNRPFVGLMAIDGSSVRNAIAMLGS
jgi:hypothetical protein